MSAPLYDPLRAERIRALVMPVLQQGPANHDHLRHVLAEAGLDVSGRELNAALWTEDFQRDDLYGEPGGDRYLLRRDETGSAPPRWAEYTQRWTDVDGERVYTWVWACSRCYAHAVKFADLRHRELCVYGPLQVPTSTLERIGELLDGYNRRATRLGTGGGLSFRRLREFLVAHHEDVECNLGGCSAKSTPRHWSQVPYTELQLTGEIPRVPGWRVLGRIEATEAGNLIHEAPGETIPVRYRSAESRCDHCNLARARNDTVLLAKGEELKQVGRNCLADFVGTTDAEARVRAFLAFGEMWAAVQAAIASREEEGGQSRYMGLALGDFLVWTAASVRLGGFVTRRKAEDRHLLATADAVVGSYLAFKKRKEKDPRLDEDFATAAAAHAWARATLTTQAAATNFDHDLAVLVGLDFIKPGREHLAVWIFEKWRTATNTAATRPGEPRLDEWRPENVGEKVQLRARIVFRKEGAAEGAWGLSDLYKLRDDSGRTLMLFTTTPDGPEVDSRIVLTAKIKRRSEREGRKETVIGKVSKGWTLDEGQPLEPLPGSPEAQAAKTRAREAKKAEREATKAASSKAKAERAAQSKAAREARKKPESTMAPRSKKPEEMPDKAKVDALLLKAYQTARWLPWGPPAVDPADRDWRQLEREAWSRALDTDYPSTGEVQYIAMPPEKRKKLSDMRNGPDWKKLPAWLKNAHRQINPDIILAAQDVGFVVADAPLAEARAAVQRIYGSSPEASVARPSWVKRLAAFRELVAKSRAEAASPASPPAKPRRTPKARAFEAPPASPRKRPKLWDRVVITGLRSDGEPEFQGLTGTLSGFRGSDALVDVEGVGQRWIETKRLRMHVEPKPAASKPPTKAMLSVLAEVAAAVDASNEQWVYWTVTDPVTKLEERGLVRFLESRHGGPGTRVLVTPKGRDALAAAAPGAPARAPGPKRSAVQLTETRVKIAADTIALLRSQDVERVLRETPAKERPTVAGVLVELRPELSPAVRDALAELGGAATPAAPRRTNFPSPPEVFPAKSLEHEQRSAKTGVVTWRDGEGRYFIAGWTFRYFVPSVPTNSNEGPFTTLITEPGKPGPRLEGVLFRDAIKAARQWAVTHDPGTGEQREPPGRIEEQLLTRHRTMRLFEGTKYVLVSSTDENERAGAVMFKVSAPTSETVIVAAPPRPPTWLVESCRVERLGGDEFATGAGSTHGAVVRVSPDHQRVTVEQDDGQVRHWPIAEVAPERAPPETAVVAPVVSEAAAEPAIPTKVVATEPLRPRIVLHRKPPPTDPASTALAQRLRLVEVSASNAAMRPAARRLSPEVEAPQALAGLGISADEAPRLAPLWIAVFLADLLWRTKRPSKRSAAEDIVWSTVRHSGQVAGSRGPRPDAEAEARRVVARLGGGQDLVDVWLKNFAVGLEEHRLGAEPSPDSEDDVEGGALRVLALHGQRARPSGPPDAARQAWAVLRDRLTEAYQPSRTFQALDGSVWNLHSTRGGFELKPVGGDAEDVADAETVARRVLHLAGEHATRVLASALSPLSYDQLVLGAFATPKTVDEALGIIATLRPVTHGDTKSKEDLAQEWVLSFIAGHAERGQLQLDPATAALRPWQRIYSVSPGARAKATTAAERMARLLPPVASLAPPLALRVVETQTRLRAPSKSVQSLDTAAKPGRRGRAKATKTPTPAKDRAQARKRQLALKKLRKGRPTPQQVLEVVEFDREALEVEQGRGEAVLTTRADAEAARRGASVVAGPRPALLAASEAFAHAGVDVDLREGSNRVLQLRLRRKPTRAEAKRAQDIADAPRCAALADWQLATQRVARTARSFALAEKRHAQATAAFSKVRPQKKRRRDQHAES